MQSGDLIIDHKGDGISSQRIIFIDEIADTVWTGNIAFVTDQGKNRRAYCPQPKTLSLKALRENIDQGAMSCVPFCAPGEWSWTDKDFAAPELSILRRERKQRLKWKIRRDIACALIAPLIEKYTIDEILQGSHHQSWPSERARALGKKSSSDIYCALHKYLVGLGNKNALLPAYGNRQAWKAEVFHVTPRTSFKGCHQRLQFG